jgi:hypothetical protein
MCIVENYHYFPSGEKIVEFPFLRRVNIVVFRRARQFICGRISSKIILL